MKYLVLDIETGGAAAENSTLLVAAFQIYDESKLIGSLELKTKPNKGEPYIVTAEGLSVNKIDLVEHDKTAITYKEAGTLLYEFLSQNCIASVDSRLVKEKYIVIGFGIHSDLQKIFSTLMNEKTFDIFCKYTRIDVSGLLLALRGFGVLDQDTPESLEAIAQYLQLQHTPHNAMSDAMVTFRIFEYIKYGLELIRLAN